MKVYVVQKIYSDYWENYSVHSTLEGAKEACKEIVKNVIDENEMNDCLEELERELFVRDVCAIEIWEVEE